MRDLDRGQRFGITVATFISGPYRARTRGRSLSESSILVGAEPALPTYATVADVLEKKNGSGLRLLGWTIARMLMIAPPMMMVGVPAGLALRGAALSSGLISLFTMIRIHNAAQAEGVSS